MKVKARFARESKGPDLHPASFSDIMSRALPLGKGKKREQMSPSYGKKQLLFLPVLNALAMCSNGADY